MDEFIRGKLEDQRENAIKRLSKILQDYHNIDKIALCVTHAFLDGCPSAIRYIDLAGLDAMDIAAIVYDCEKYADMWTDECNDKIGEMLYDNSQRD